jgi:anaerobic C4-dicarboxylate transporter DcuB
MEILLQVAVILICLFYGARKGGVALGLLGGIGIVIMAFVFKLAPGKPPVDVMLTIIAVVAASATLQASGGLEVMLMGAEKLLRRNPKYVSILAPFTTCLTDRKFNRMRPSIAPWNSPQVAEKPALRPQQRTD